MKSLLSLFALLILIMVVIVNVAYADASLSNDDKSSAADSSAIDDSDETLRKRKEVNSLIAQKIIPSPRRRHPLKFGVLGKRYLYGYLGKRDDEPNVSDDFQEWLDNTRRQAASRPRYGLLG